MCEFLRRLPLDAISIFLNKLCETVDSSYLRAISSLVFPDNGELGPDILYHITGRTPDLQCIFGNHLKPGLSRPVARSAGQILRPQVCDQILRPQVCSSNSETPGLQFKQCDPRSAVQTVRP